MPEKYVLLEMDFDTPAPLVQPQQTSFTFGGPTTTKSVAQSPGGFFFPPQMNNNTGTFGSPALPATSLPLNLNIGQPNPTPSFTFGASSALPVTSSLSTPTTVEPQYTFPPSFGSGTPGSYGLPSAPPQSSSANNPIEFKCLIIGDGGVGKTTFVTRHVSDVVQLNLLYSALILLLQQTGEFTRQYNRTFDF